MDYLQKAEALEALGELSIKFRTREWRIGTVCPFYADVKGVEIKDRSILKGGGGNGDTPEQAIEALWSTLTELQQHEYLVVHAAYQDSRRAVRWNGFMWADVKEPPKDKAAA